MLEAYRKTATAEQQETIVTVAATLNINL